MVICETGPPTSCQTAKDRLLPPAFVYGHTSNLLLLRFRLAGTRGKRCLGRPLCHDVRLLTIPNLYLVRLQLHIYYPDPGPSSGPLPYGSTVPEMGFWDFSPFAEVGQDGSIHHCELFIHLCGYLFPVPSYFPEETTEPQSIEWML